VVVSPHCAAHTGESLERMASDAARCIVEFFRGQTPAWIVNQDPEKALRATERR
jgi:phosphoglycerate dehydrogenase-like enzyme